MALAELDLPTRRATIRLARGLAAQLIIGDLLVLAGPLGAGKTFFARAVCRALGVPEQVRVTSPSFSLIHEFEATIPVVHADLYRVGCAEEVEQLGLRELRARAFVMVEWGAPFAQLLGGAALQLDLAVAHRGRSAVLRATEGLDANRAARVAAAIASASGRGTRGTA